MHDMRRKQRRNSPHRVNVLEASDDRILGRLVNITTGGLMFLSERSFTTGTRLRLRLPLPTITGGKPAVEAEGTVAWCRQDENPRYQRVGVEFANLAAEDGYLIETVLQRMHLVG